VEGARPRGRPKKTWREIVEKDCQVHGLKREDAMESEVHKAVVDCLTFPFRLNLT